MNRKRLRTIIPLALLVLAGIGYATTEGVGNLSAFGWHDISLLCPLGALGSMLAAKTLIPRAVFSVIAVVIVVLLVGRAFCAWVCPIPVMQKARDLFSRKKSTDAARLRPLSESEQHALTLKGCGACEASDGSCGTDGAAGCGTSDFADCGVDDAVSRRMSGIAGCEADGAASREASGATERRSGRHRKSLSDVASCGANDATSFEASREAAGDNAKRPLTTRRVVLGGSLLSAAIFGFPVFCVICPVGLSFATVFLLIRAFGFGDASWTLVLVPALLVVEVVLLRRWCHTFCPLAALMSLIGKGNRTFQPHVERHACLEAQGATCGRCAAACPEGIDPRNRKAGTPMSECTRCLACTQACPTHAARFSFLPPRRSQNATAAQAGDSTTDDNDAEIAR